jgi:heme-degrading monooxygenase HmoA
MVLEVADIRVPQGSEAEAEAAIVRGLDEVLSRARGYVRHELRRGVESPTRYLLLIEWESVDDHVVGFRESPAYDEWSAIVRPFFASPPSVEHFELAASSR